VALTVEEVKAAKGSTAGDSRRMRGGGRSDGSRGDSGRDQPHGRKPLNPGEAPPAGNEIALLILLVQHCINQIGCRGHPQVLMSLVLQKEAHLRGRVDDRQAHGFWTAAERQPNHITEEVSVRPGFLSRTSGQYEGVCVPSADAGDHLGRRAHALDVAQL
jgi:hypothetical protein